nr:hypothetical protein GCM10020092_019840 [Actinoplanes digitatis]
MSLGRVPVRVVDQLEVVQVDEQQGDVRAGADHVGEDGVQPGPVGQAGQRVVQGQLFEFELALAEPRLDLLAAHDVAAQRGGRGVDPAHRPVAGVGEQADQQGQQQGDRDRHGERVPDEPAVGLLQQPIGRPHPQLPGAQAER